MRPGLLVSALWLAAVAGAAGEPGWRAELAVGGAHSFGSSLRLEQAGLPALLVDAEWDTRSLESPLYYALRLTRGNARGAWALRFIHHKLYLTNPPPEVERFAVSHGYNLLTLERAFPISGFELCAAAGVVIAHPESTVRGETRAESAGKNLDAGYFLTGPTAALAVRRGLRLGTHVAIVPELRFTLSRARVPIAAGEASVPNAALHLILGLELRF